MAGDDQLIVQKQASVQDVINDHINGMGGYEIAEKYGIDSEKVKEIIREADEAGKFMPEGSEAKIDKISDTPEPLVEGENPGPEVDTTDKKKK